jgi:hypothetical protein
LNLQDIDPPVHPEIVNRLETEGKAVVESEQAAALQVEGLAR